ncbi:golgin subfamily A member 5 isoform X2 [Parasteatoda tepidariorum]|uniref:golgin subfamily A member 5 isoform X2 n=1 Tax=Parasteatoda tepidariorum TaxID=114398 RepID=UPI001C725466|nr:golgin subfamily A member 5 isoform X2 [Parasteatoda tepidariorum]
MSWFTEIAGKAEDLLNRVDQKAANALQITSKTTSHDRSISYHEQSFDEQIYAPSEVYSSAKPLITPSVTPKTVEQKATNSSSSSITRKKSESDDEKLLRFLNSEPLPTPTRRVKEKAVPKKEEHMDSNLESQVATAENENEEMKRMAKKLEHWNSQISGSDKNVRELRERQKDMVAAMDAKDSQIAILKVRLQEADQELSAKLVIIEELKAENDRIIKEHADGALVQNKTIQTLQQQLQEIEVELLKTKDSLALVQTQHMQQFDKMEAEHRHLVESYSSLQKKWSELNEKNKDLSMQFKLSTSNLEAVQQEYNDYKQKAQRILQSKEKLISSLKEGNTDLESIEKNEASSLLLNAEIEAIKQERDLLKDEIRRANELVETYRSEMQELEKISQSDMLASQEQCKTLKDSFDIEKNQKEEFLLLSNQLKEELQFLREDFARNKNAFQSRLQDREIEIEKLRRQLTAKSLSTVSQEELESRLHALTENLIQKQTIVEALSTEKNSLVLQLERMEQQLREAHSFNSQQHTFVGISSSETERKSKAVFLDNPFDSTLTRRVKRVYGSLDSFSIRLGVFFRRYPASRVFVIIYMLLLHFWVLFVLLTYEPEIHSSGYENPQTH